MTIPDGSSVSHPSVSIALLGVEGRSRPLLSQLPLVATMLVIGASFSSFYPGLVLNPLFVAGYAVLGLSVLYALVAPWHLLGPKAPLLLPMLDFVAVGLSRSGSQSVLDAMGLLAVFPAIRLATADKYRGVLFGTLATAAVIALPLFFSPGPVASQQWARLTLFPVVVCAVGLTVTIITQRLQERAADLRATSTRLERALADSRSQGELLESILEAVDVGVVAVGSSGEPILTNNAGLASERRAAQEARRGGAAASEWQFLGEATKTMFESDRSTPIPAHRRPIARASRGEMYSNYLIWVEEKGTRRAYSATARPIRTANPAGADPKGTANRKGATPNATSDADGAGFVVAFANVTALLEASAAQTRFVAAVSHELRTPMTSIVGYADLLRERLDEAGITHTPELDVIERNAEKLRSRVQDLMSAAESTLSIAPVRMDLAAAVHNAVDSILPAAARRSITIDNQAHHPVVALLDPERIGQVLDNLFSNAVKYSSPGTTITVRSRNDSEAAQAVLEIEDQGVGLTAAEQDRVFTQFFRTSSARGSSAPGSGLGLSIVKSIVDRHGGSIRLDSIYGEGTTAVLRLPLAADPAGEG